jgi:predicted DNA-binding transcriptional regulator YafY
LETQELKLLLDAVQASKFLAVKRSRDLTNKLLSLASNHQAQALAISLQPELQVKPRNEAAYLTADLLLNAISAKRQVQFLYYEYGPDKKRAYKHGRRLYEFSPWALVWNNDSYYVIGYSKSHGKDVKFRVDRIASPKLTDQPIVPAPEGFSAAAYTASVFQMFDGPALDVTLKCENNMMDVIVDRFGESS